MFPHKGASNQKNRDSRKGIPVKKQIKRSSYHRG